MLFTLPMLIPSISHGMGLVILFGSNGILTNWLHLPSPFTAFGGIVIGSVLYSFPVAFLMLLDVLKYEDGTAYEAAAVLGISKGRQIRSLLLPYLRKPLISVIFATFTLIVTDYGVPLMVGGKYMTLPVMMYNGVTGLLDLGRRVIGACLLIPAVAAFLIDLFTKESNGQNFVTRPRSVAPGRGRDVFCTLLCIVAGVLILLPIAAFVLLTFVRKYPVDMSFTFQNILKTMGSRRGRLSDKLPDHRLFRRLDRYGGFLSHRLSDSPFPRDILRAAPPHLHHFPSHPRYGAGPLLFLVLRRQLPGRDAVDPDSGEHGPFLRLPLSDGLQFLGQAQRKPGGCGPYPGYRPGTYGTAGICPSDPFHLVGNVFLFLRQLHDDHFRRVLPEPAGNRCRCP